MRLLSVLLSICALAAPISLANAESGSSPHRHSGGEPVPAPGSAQHNLTRSKEQRYVFPIAAPPSFMSWTHVHWDGGSAVDIEAALNLAPNHPRYRVFASAPVVAVTAGTARPADNIRGGTAVVLEGDDGNQYYYAHLESRTVEKRRAVRRGEVLGQIGNSGKWTKYLEEHLHFAVASGHREGLEWKNDVNAAEWIRNNFGFAWRGGPETAYDADLPAGWPFVTPGRLIRDYEQLSELHPELAGLEVAPRHGGRAAVISPLSGEVNVVRATRLGLRVQVTNRKTNASIILSGLEQVTPADGAAVAAGDVLGYLAAGESLLYHYFADGELTNPEPLLGDTSPLFE